MRATSTMMFYMVFMLPGFLLMMWAQSKVKGAYERWSRIGNSAHLTGAQAARRVLDANGLQSVGIEPIAGQLSDHYDPRKRTLFLSQGVYNAPSIAAVGIAAHEAGHAIQHAQGYAPLTFRTSIVPLVNIGSNFGMLVLIAGMMMQSAGIAWAGVGLFALSTLFALVTLPVEFDASARAKKALVSTGVVDGGAQGGEESRGVADVLSSAAWTYVAGFAASVLTLLYYVMAVSGMGGRNRD